MSDNEQFIAWTDFEAGLNASATWEDSDLYNLRGDHFNIEAVCPDYRPESQCWATWRRDERGVAIVSGYDPELDLGYHFEPFEGYEDDDLGWESEDGPPDYIERFDDEGKRTQNWEEDLDEPDYWLPGDLL